MTTEHLLLIEVGDVQGLRVVCAQCRAAVVYKLDETIYLPGDCPGCQRPWANPGGQDVAQAAFKRLVTALKEWARVEHDAPYRFRFEIVQPLDAGKRP